ncbi:MAG: hypothetical protein ABI980_12395 [Nitrospirota bacterium]
MASTQHLQAVPEESSPAEAAGHMPSQRSSLWYWVLGSILVLLIGSWFVGLSAYLQRKFIEDDIRAACQRVMPENVERCVDTVIIQRGGVRR